jgi:hypothetical protein
MNNDNDNALSAKSQCDMIIAWLKKGYSLTQLEALNKFGCFRLASRIHDLRERGYNIIACRITTPSGKRICEYILSN